MSMWVQYGAYAHDPGEVEFSITKEALVTERETPFAELVGVTLNGQLVGSSPRDMDDKVEALLNAYATDGKDFLVKISESTNAVISITSSSTNGGVRVVQPPSFPSNRQAAYVTFLPYTIRIEAEVPVSNPATLLRSFTESITRSGGGPRFGMLEPVYGRPVRQRLKQQTVYRVVQEGRAVGLYSRPIVPAAIWPRALLKTRDITLDGGRRRGSGSDSITMDLGISWRYEFESDRPLIGTPASWGFVNA